MQNRNSVINQKVDLTVGVADSVNLIGIFTLFLNDVLVRFLEETARFFMFPFAAMAAGIRAVLAWRQAKLDNGNNGSILRAAVETAGALAIGTAVVGGFVAASTFALVAPIIFTATIGAKTLYHAGCALYYWGKSAGTSDSAQKQAYQSAAKANAIGTVAHILSTVAVGLVMLAAKPIFAVLGIVAGAIGTTFSLYKLCTTVVPAKTPKGYKELKDDAQLNKNDNDVSHEKTLTRSAKLHQDLRGNESVKQNMSFTQKISVSKRGKLFDVSNHEERTKQAFSQPTSDSCLSLSKSF